MTLTVMRGGRLYSGAHPDATALAFTESTITWIGPEHAVAQAGRPERVVDLGGCLVVPGFVDAHVHCTDAGLALTGLDLSRVASLAEFLRVLAGYARREPDGLLWGHGWDETCWPEGRPPAREEVDAAVGGRRAAYLSRIDLHSAQISSALSTQVCDRSGAEPAGADRLPGWSPTDPVTRDAHAAARRGARAALSSAQRDRAQRAFLRVAAAHGVVEVHECAADTAAGRSDLAALLTGEHPVAVRGYLAAPATAAEHARQLLAETQADALGGDLVVDGAIGSRTAALREPYLDAPGTCGSRYLGEGEIRDHLVACTEAGIQAGFHAIGDDAVSAVGAALARAAERLGPDGGVRLAAQAHRLEHAEMPDSATIAALARYGVVASVQPMFDRLWGGPDRMYALRLGAERARAMNPFAALAAAGITLAFGSDAPVTPVDPWSAVRAAVNHRTPGSGISPRAALTAHTRGGHRAARRTDRSIGTLSVGAPAHLVIVEAGDLVRPAADPRVQRWSTDPRSRVPLLPDLNEDSPAPRTVATIASGTLIFDTGLFDRN